MSYQSGFLHQRVTIRNKVVAAGFGDTTGYQDVCPVWANISFSKGMKALHEGALDAYDTVMFRCRFIEQLDRWCLLKFKGKWYQITSFNDDYQDNQIQITATELANQQVNIVEPYSTTDIGPTTEGDI
jgi:head-tail adaptor